MQSTTHFKYCIPFVFSTVSAGFPSPAQDYIEDSIDISQKLIKNPSSTFLVRAHGDSMKDSNIQNGDILIVDKSLEVKNNDIVIAYIDGEFTVKRFFKSKNHITLYPANSNYKPIHISSGTDFLIWGVVTYVLHKYR
jgi:DNA polymerase V